MPQILIEHLKNARSRYLNPKASFIIGVSGGPDSMALLYLLHKLDAEAVVVHVNYGKRGKQSNLDQELVEQMSFEWGFECSSITLNPKDAEGQNFQDWARNQRYQFFRDLKSEAGADAIATAHHQNDQVETILQKIFRGSSPTAWQGMNVWDGELFRPLLPFSKEDILTFCEAEAVPFRVDESNAETDFARNFLRNELAPKMDELFPGWQSNLLSLPTFARTYQESMNLLAHQVSSGNSIHLEKFAELPDVLKPAILKTILDQAGLKGDYSKGQLQEVAEIERLQTGKKLRIGNFLLIRDRNEILVRPDNHEEDPSKSTLLTKNSVEKGVQEFGFSFNLNPSLDKNAVLRLDAGILSWPLTLRTWRAGDVFIPLGMNGHQKISDHLTNRKIPTFKREKALVLCGSDGTIYAIIYPVKSTHREQGAISDMAKCTSTSQTFLTINNI